MNKTMLLVGVALIVGAFALQYYWNERAYDIGEGLVTGEVELETYLDAYKNSGNIRLIFWVLLIIGGMVVFAGLTGAGSHRSSRGVHQIALRRHGH